MVSQKLAGKIAVSCGEIQSVSSWRTDSLVFSSYLFSNASTSTWLYRDE